MPSRGKNSYSHWEMWYYYRTRCKPKKKITQAQYSEILNDFLRIMFEKMVNEGFVMHLHAGLGKIYVVKEKIKFRVDENGNAIKRGIPKDWGKSRKLWKELYPEVTNGDYTHIPNKPIIYHVNKHTDGYVHRFFWDKYTATFANRFLYCLAKPKIIRDILSEHLMKPGAFNDYYENKFDVKLKDKEYVEW